MLRTIEIIKEQIKAIQYDQRVEKKSEVQELRELVEFINYDREILLSENKRLTKIIEENNWKCRYLTMQEDLEREISRNEELFRRIEDLEEIIAGMGYNKSCMESGSFTDRSNSSMRGSEKLKNCMSSSMNERSLNSKAKYSGASINKSPEKPPRAYNKNSKVNSKLPDPASVQIKTSLAKAIDEAHKTLIHTAPNKNRSISPCLSTGSSRYSTPPKKLNLNASLASSNL